MKITLSNSASLKLFAGFRSASEPRLSGNGLVVLLNIHNQDKARVLRERSGTHKRFLKIDDFKRFAHRGLPKWLMRRIVQGVHIEVMSSTILSGLELLSQSMVDLVKNTTPGLVAVRVAPYRTVSGIALPGGLIATAHHSLRREEQRRSTGSGWQ